jgi:hypothetical protein
MTKMFWMSCLRGVLGIGLFAGATLFSFARLGLSPTGTTFSMALVVGCAQYGLYRAVVWLGRRDLASDRRGAGHWLRLGVLLMLGLVGASLFVLPARYMRTL